VTELAVAGELAAAAGLLMGKLERIPAVLIRGYPFPAAEGRARSLVRPAERDLFDNLQCPLEPPGTHS
jgi:coenzyme F420-0:L-glutamate ligase/coenzyme F420-1:gamma-L-glutamate ligase